MHHNSDAQGSHHMLLCSKAFAPDRSDGKFIIEYDLDLNSWRSNAQKDSLANVDNPTHVEHAIECTTTSSGACSSNDQDRLHTSLLSCTRNIAAWPEQLSFVDTGFSRQKRPLPPTVLQGSDSTLDQFNNLIAYISEMVDLGEACVFMLDRSHVHSSEVAPCCSSLDSLVRLVKGLIQTE